MINAYPFKKQFLLLILSCSITVCKSQIENRNLFPTPNAASLGEYGQVPVDYFNGLPQINVPLCEFKSGSINVPVELSYHGGGVKPADHSSWVGLGWSLQAGGAITRIVNDLPDEYINMAMAYDEAGSDIQAAINANKDGYFYNYALLGDSNWSTTNLSTEFNLLYPSLPSYPSQMLYDYQHRKDKAPDEFAFNFMGMSGSLFMGQDGQWKMKSKQGLNFKVSYVTGPYLVTDPNCTFSGSTVYNCLTKFILTSNDGTQYYFGADTISNINATSRRYGITGGGSFVQNWGLNHKNFFTDDSTAIEFTRINSGGGDALNGRDGGTVPISWYLTKIKSVSGDSVTFKYSRDGYQIINNPAGSFYQYTCSSCYSTSGGGGSVTGADDQLSILDGVSLASINGINGSVQFSKSKANILDYSLLGWSLPQSTLDLFCAYSWELFNGGMANCASSEVAAKHSTFMKLDTIKIISNNKTLKSINFRYTENTNNRLFLDSLIAKGTDGISVTKTSFAYNNKAALARIPYETVDVDHWGYYNGVNPLCSYFSSACSGTFNWVNLLNPAITDYINSRAPNEDSAELGILTHINYPTGGNTEFVWEPNTYSKTISHNVSGNTFSISLVDQHNSLIGAGLRIKQINSTAGFNAPVITKNYLYNRDYIHHTSYLSSGVLNSSLPKYTDSYTDAGVFTYNIWTSFIRTPMHLTNGSLVTYTNVIEQNNDGSMIEYIYSNHDNGYSDRVPVSSIYYDYTNFSFQDYQCSSDELERGLLLNESTYKPDFTLLSTKSYQYNNDSNRFSNNVRKYLGVNKFALAGSLYFPFATETHGAGFFPSDPIYQGADMYALETYTYYPYLKSETSVQYDQNGLNPLTTISNYTYDNYRNKKTTTTTNSKGEILVATTKYPVDNISGLSSSAEEGKNSMVSSGMTGIPLETTVTLNGNPIKYNRIDYKLFPALKPFAVPLNSYEGNSADFAELKTQYLNFNDRGNILEYIKRDGIPTSFEWGYDREYPVVKIINAVNTKNISYSLTNSTITGHSPTFQLGPGSPSYSSSLSFNQSETGTITLASTTSLPQGANVSIYYTLSGPSNQSGYLCSSGSGGPSCYSTPSTISFTNMPSGSYTLSFSASTSFQSYSFNLNLDYSYRGQIMVGTPVGIKEFFYEGFEGSAGGNVMTGLAHTGTNLYNGSYTVSYVPPVGKTYTIQWWDKEGSEWIRNQQAYTPDMVLTGIIDDIRVFPSDALMTTYTYSPLTGITSQLDPNGKALYYDYDGFGRLAMVRDQDKNVIKKICYDYAGQPGNCNISVVTSYTNVAKSGLFYRNNCSAFYTGSTVTYTVPAGTYTSYISQEDADQKAQDDVNTNGQAYANTYGTCTANIGITGQHSFSCSSTGGTSSGSGVITGPPGYLTTVTLSAYGSSGTYTTYVTLSGGVSISKSVSNGSTSFTFTMPSSGSVNWSGSISCPNYYGSGSVSAY